MSLWVNAGVTSWTDDGQLIKVASKVIHEKFNNVTNQHDVGLAFLETRLTIGFGVQTLELTRLYYNPECVLASVAGWGYDTCKGSTTSNLKGLSVISYSDDDCLDMKGSLQFFPGDQLCGGNIGRPTDEVYSGDSGGPLVFNNTQIGIVSRSLCKQTDPHYVARYASIVYHRSWIEKKTLEKFYDDNLKTFYEKFPSEIQNPFGLFPY